MSRIVANWEGMNRQSGQKDKKDSIILSLHSIGIIRYEIESLLTIGTRLITRLRQFDLSQLIVQDPRSHDFNEYTVIFMKLQ